MPAIPPHNTAVVDKPWDGPGTEAKIANDAGAATLRKEYAWVDSSKDAATKAAYKFPHHEVDGGQPGAANINGVRNALSRLSGADIPESDRAGVKAHLDRHMAAFNKGGQSAEELPVEGARALFGQDLEIRSSEQDEERGLLGTLVGYLAVFNEWTEIDSTIEGHFMERVAAGAFRKTFQERLGRIRCIFHHGNDPSVGIRVLGPVDVLEEREDGAYSEVGLLDTSYNRDLLPGLKAGLYGMSFRFRAVRQDTNRNPRKSQHNPRGIPERTLTELAIPEFGPTPFPAYAGAVAGMRSLTDELLMGRLASDPQKLDELLRRSGLQVAVPRELESEDVKCPECGAMNTDDAVYCDQCGEELDVESESVPSRVPADTAEAHRLAQETREGLEAATRPYRRRVVTDALYERSVSFAATHPWEMTPEALAIVQAILSERASGYRPTPEEVQERLGIRAAELEEQPVSPVQVISITGPIVPRGGMFSDVSGMASVSGISAQLRAALANDDVKSIVFDVDSPGGSSAMIPELTAEIAAARGQKPMIAVANTLMASAAYHLMSQADEVVASPSADVGSIGVYAAHTDLTKAMEQLGKKVTMVHSAGSPHKTELQPFVELSDDAREELQRRVDSTYEDFVGHVAAGRGTTTDDVKDNYGKGRVLSADDALKVGMIDRIDTFDNVLAQLLGDTAPAPAVTGADSVSSKLESVRHPVLARRGGLDRRTLQPKEEPRWRL